MAINSRIKKIEKILNSKNTNVTVRFFDNHEDYIAAYEAGNIGENDISFIDDIP